jgi:hypothetical protein
MINYQECFRYYLELLKVCDEHTTHGIVQWYQTTCRFYGDESPEWIIDFRISKDNAHWISNFKLPCGDE